MLHDLRYAFRSLRHNPGFALVAIVSLALGIGANAAIFAFADGLVLRPMSVPHPGRLLTVEMQINGEAIGGLYSFSGLSYRDFQDLSREARSFTGLTATSGSTFGFAADRGEIPKMKFGEIVSAGFFDVLDVKPSLGRTFRADEDKVPGRDAVAVISYELWKSDFASTPDIVGRTFYLNTIPFTVIGVAPESFNGSISLIHSALFVPAAMGPRLASDPEMKLLDRRDARAFSVYGTLKPGISISQAAAEARGIGAQLAQSYPESNRTASLLVETSLSARLRRDIFDVMLMGFLMALSSVVLLISCANVMNLMLSRAGARAREIAVRLAIGAGRGRLIRQLLVESLMIALAGGVLGLVVAQAGVELFGQIQPPAEVPVVFDFRLDPRVLIFSLALSIASAVIFGLAPALKSTRPDLTPALKSGRTASGKRRRFFGRNALVVTQVAGSLLLLIFASQAYRGATILLSSPMGFRTDHVLMAAFDPSLALYKKDQATEFYKKLLDKARAQPGVREAALMESAPLMPGSLYSRRVVPEGFRLPAGQDALSVLANVVSDDYFAAIGTPIVAGREFLATDRIDTPHVAVVNEQFARKYFPDQNAIGKRLRMLDNPTDPPVEIVGIARQSKYVFPAEPLWEFLYLPLAQHPKTDMTLALHTVGPPGDWAEPVRNIVRSLDAGQPIIAMRTMEDFYDQRARRTMNVLIEAIAALGVLGLVLAMVGLYGLMTYSVGLRQREIGIRMAIGADPRGVLAMVLKQGLLLAGVGSAIGLVASLLLGRPAMAVIGESSFHLPLVAAVFVSLLAVAALGAYVPARRASRLDPNTVLRQE
jgi:predicted permease